MDKILFSSMFDGWRTPDELFKKLDNEFHFGIDVAADKENAKCPVYITKEENALLKDWGGRGAIFCNPPYSRKLGEWVEKAVFEHHRTGETVVLLIPARTDTKWFHKFVLPYAREIRFIKGRIKFLDRDGKLVNSATFPSMVVIFKQKGGLF